MKIFFILCNVIIGGVYAFQKSPYIRSSSGPLFNTRIQPPTAPPEPNRFLKLIRYKNIVPTAMLCFAGGWIIDPNHLFHSRNFVVSTIDTLIIMSNSMVINDIYDLEIDKINNKFKTLVTGEIEMSEAIFLFLSLLGISEALSLLFLPENMQIIVNMANIYIGLYTPIFKRIPVVKNIACAAIVSISVFFGGLAAGDHAGGLITENANFGLLAIAMNTIFWGSLSNEIVLDIRDVEGDKANNVYTVPVIFGSKNAMILANTVMFYNAVSSTLALNFLYENRWGGLPVWLILTILQYESAEIYNNNFSEKSIYAYLKRVNKSMILLLVYMCALATYSTI